MRLFGSFLDSEEVVDELSRRVSRLDRTQQEHDVRISRIHGCRAVWEYELIGRIEAIEARISAIESMLKDNR